MRFSTRSKLSILLSLVTIVAFVFAFMMTAFSQGQATHAANGSSASGATSIKGQSTLAGSGNLFKLPKTTGSGSVKVFKGDLANRRGVSSTIPSSGSGVPSTTATALGSSSTNGAIHSSSHAGTLLKSFDGVSDLDNGTATGFILTPPDQGLCVGPLAVAGKTVVFEPVNITMRVFDTNGNDLVGVPIPLSALFNEPAFPTEFLSDPRCQFDKSTGDFFFTILAFNFPAETQSHIDVTVVHQDGSANFYKFDTTDATNTARGCPCFADQPLLGIDKYNLYVSGNEFPILPSQFFNGAEVFAISKSQLDAGAPANFAEFLHISDQGILIETLQPAITYDANAPAEYLLHSFTVDVNGANNSFDHRLGIFAITNQAAVTAGGFPTLSNPTVINSELYAQPNLALQPDNTLVLNPDDDRMQQVEYINGNLMGALSTAVSIKGDTITRDGAAWFDIEPSLQGSLTVKAHIKHQGYIAASGLYILYPAILQSKNGTVEMAFSITNGTTNPSAAYAVVPDGKHSSNAGAINVAATGNGTYFDDFSCSGVLPPGCRWGDYSWITLDPSSSNFWMGSEYIPPAARQFFDANWGTRVYEVSG
jgi:hypothetical protein